MLNLFFIDYYFFFPIVLNFFIFWQIFFKINFLNKNNISHNDLLIKKKIKVNFFSSFYIKIQLTFIFLYIVFLSNFKSISFNFFWNNFFLINFNFNIIYLFFFLNFFIILFFYYLENQTFKSNHDFFFIISNVSLILPFIFSTQNFLIFFFFIEILAYLFFLNFILTKIWNFNNLKNYFLHLKNNYFKNYINLIFFHFWSTFFSSIIILFFILILNNYFFCLDFNLLNFFSFSMPLFNNIIFFASSLIFILFIALKLGIAPIHFFKIEIYNGLSLLNIVFYSSFYFIFIFLFFSVILIFYLTSLSYFFFFCLLFLTILSFFTIINFLFDINSLKSFFGFSAISNFIIFLLIITISLN